LRHVGFLSISLKNYRTSKLSEISIFLIDLSKFTGRRKLQNIDLKNMKSNFPKVEKLFHMIEEDGGNSSRRTRNDTVIQKRQKATSYTRSTIFAQRLEFSIRKVRRFI